jgi:putative tricarboxylic transport membrane protein
VLIPVIASLCILGAFSYRCLPFDMVIVLFFGVIGYFMERTGIPMAPFVLAFVLGKSAEIDLRRALILMSGKGFGELLQPLPLALLLVDIVFLIAPFWGSIKKLFKRKPTN